MSRSDHGEEWLPEASAAGEANPSEEFADDEGELPATRLCPYCREEVLDDLPQCPACGQYFSREDAPAAGQPPWVLATVVICLVLILAALAAW